MCERPFAFRSLLWDLDKSVNEIFLTGYFLYDVAAPLGIFRGSMIDLHAANCIYRDTWFIFFPRAADTKIECLGHSTTSLWCVLYEHTRSGGVGQYATAVAAEIRCQLTLTAETRRRDAELHRIDISRCECHPTKRRSTPTCAEASAGRLAGRQNPPSGGDIILENALWIQFVVLFALTLSCDRENTL